MSKISAIVKSFITTVCPAFPIYFFTYIGLFVYLDWIENIFFPAGMLIYVFLFPLFYMVFCGGVNCFKALGLAFMGFKGELQDSYYVEKDKSDNINIKVVKSRDKGLTNAALYMIGGIIVSPLVIIVWIIQIFRIIMSQPYCETINKTFNENRSGAIFYLCLSIASILICCSNFAILPLQDKKYSVDSFNFEYVSFEYTGKEWGEKWQYDLKYEFQNNGSKLGKLHGDIIIEGRNGLQYKIEDKNLTVYSASLYYPDFNKQLVYYYFYVPKAEVELNNMLKSNNNDFKIYLSVSYSDWDSNRIRNYKNGKQIILKDFGNNNQFPTPQKPDSGEGTEISSTEQKYQQAITLYNSGEYEQALAKFNELGNYKQSVNYVTKCEDKLFYVQMEKDLVSVAGNNAILPNNYELYFSYSKDYYIYYDYDYHLGFSADLYSSQLDIQSFLNNFETKLVNNGYSCLSSGVYKKDNTVILLGYFEGDSYFTYQAFKIF